jgi:hypothetical protein
MTDHLTAPSRLKAIAAKPNFLNISFFHAFNRERLSLAVMIFVIVKAMSNILTTPDNA